MGLFSAELVATAPSHGNEVLFAPLGFKNVEWWSRDKAGRYPGGWVFDCAP
jgi:hypothetical protein